jgi:uncharacterized membrane protein YjjB (DUF3815 family)
MLLTLSWVVAYLMGRVVGVPERPAADFAGSVAVGMAEALETIGLVWLTLELRDAWKR